VSGEAGEPTTGELRLAQLRRELEERERAEKAETGEDTGSHERRADKAAYLREKLEQRERAEREAGLPGDDD
jgi:hypothetical protein